MKLVPPDKQGRGLAMGVCVLIGASLESLYVFASVDDPDATNVSSGGIGSWEKILMSL